MLKVYSSLPKGNADQDSLVDEDNLVSVDNDKLGATNVFCAEIGDVAETMTSAFRPCQTVSK